MAYITENREEIRSHIGRLMYGNKFLTGTVATVGANFITSLRARRFGEDHFTGAVIYFVDGAAEGDSTYVGANEAGTGKLTLSPVPTVMPEVGDKFEIWPEDTSVEDVNDAINMAIMDVQHIALDIDVETSPTIDSEYKRITIPADWALISRLTYEYGGYKFKLRPRDPRDPMPWDQIEPVTFDIEGSTIVIWGAVPTSATNLRLVGYRKPSLLTDDITDSTIRSDYLTYKAASILTQDQMASDILDPGRSGQKATFWAQQAEQKKREMQGQVLSNTMRVEEYI